MSLPVTSGRPSGVLCCLLFVVCCVGWLAVGCWLLAVGCCLLPVACWLLAVGVVVVVAAAAAAGVVVVVVVSEPRRCLTLTCPEDGPLLYGRWLSWSDGGFGAEHLQHSSKHEANPTSQS